MANKMLIDAAHPEETRVVVVRGNRVEEFDFEAANRKQLRGNIYLAKVTRVEPSLQAAFVEYGGNRHGFLAFSEIHPDYYQIPVADRLALLAEEQRSHRDEDEEDENGGEGRRNRDRRRGRNRGQNRSEAAEAESHTRSSAAEGDENDGGSTDETFRADGARESEDAAPERRGSSSEGGEEESSGGAIVEVGSGSDEEHIEALGGGDAADDIPERVVRSRKQYKIQEVIKRRQVLLVQVVKEERGNKGAALTTYLSLAGRYSVLMPNTARGGGISRKITNAIDRKRLKAVAGELDVPDGMGVILRTAGASRTKVEIKRDFEYLLRLWENVRDLTLKSAAPTLVYEEGSLIKRSIRDLYNKDIDEVIVAGDDGYREAKDFMRMLMPSHAKNVQAYREAAPLFQRFGVEAQLDAMFSPSVSLKSGGYIVINQTEALVSIDVNSGRATREHNIEDTALKTNMEAAEEISRQLRLRDLAGLIVIDFIDMDESRNNRSVERKLKDCLKNDRARIQVGRISHFGLMEMSRQRIRTGVLESSTEVCPHCGGSGHVRSVTSVALHILRALEDQLLKSATHNLVLRTRTATALYVLNHKRGHLYALEARFGVAIIVSADESIVGSQNYLIERGELATPQEPRVVSTTVQVDSFPPVEEVAEVEEEVDVAADEEEAETQASPRAARPQEGEAEGADGGRKRRRRRRRRRGHANGPDTESQASAEESGDDADEGGDVTPADSVEVEVPGAPEAGEITPAAEAAPANAEEVSAAEADDTKRRRRGRRGGRRAAGEDEAAPAAAAAVEAAEAAPAAEIPAEPAPEAAPAPKARRRGRKQVPITTEAAPAPEAVTQAPAEAVSAPAEAEQPFAEQGPEPAAGPAEEAAPPAAAQEPTASAEAVEPPAAEAQPAADEALSTEPEPAPPAPAIREVLVSNPDAYVYVDAIDPAKPKRAGWWSKK
ncbi:Rne/Rng family ribonuclease [Labrys monachus]|uniref:Ribonuclease E n=1 Tax=Labrys monachus TaxID=217067 RepID=A0ABU0FGP9_9HYPH|nr:ribonuclease E/G [Labrys monachus]MDQ0393788.1 ribonuclease E [Labrys monachus]